MRGAIDAALIARARFGLASSSTAAWFLRVAGTRIGLATSNAA